MKEWGQFAHPLQRGLISHTSDTLHVWALLTQRDFRPRNISISAEVTVWFANFRISLISVFIITAASLFYECHGLKCELFGHFY